MSYIAIVKTEGNSVTKFAEYTKKSDADAHVAEHGGFVCDAVDGNYSWWVVDSSEKTLSYNKDAHDAFKLSQVSNAYKQSRMNDYPTIQEQLDLLYHDMSADKGDITGEWYKAVKATKDKYPKE